MLHRLSINNYAIIESVEIEFCDSMNIITGETGAGKSILLGALGLILGERADTKILYNENEKCVVEADFEIENKNLISFFDHHELDFDTHTIVRREINQNGKSRAFINDTPVTLAVLKELGENLVNLHTQHETLDLVKSGFQLQVIDTLANLKSDLAAYQTKFGEYKQEQKIFAALTQKNKNAASELDYLNFQLSELAEAQLKAEEQIQLESEQKTLSHIEDIQKALQNTLNLFSNSELNLLDQLKEVQVQIKPVKNLNSDILDLSTRLQSAQEELKDIAKEFEAIQETTSLDPERLEEVNNRLSTLYRLQKKHSVQTVEELITIRQDIEKKLQSADNNTMEEEELKKSLEKKLVVLLQLAEQLHIQRGKVLREFQNNVVVLLTKVGMPNASFKVEIRKNDEALLNESGLTEIKFLFSANKGFAPLEIKEVASGGELSRLMLCIKSLVAGAGSLPTMIFDEIDSGISGEVALKVGEIMKSLSRKHQLIAITHLPQIARSANSHLYIYKETVGNRTSTKIRELKGEERVVEIAKMLSGEKISDASLANARELIG